MVEDSNTFGYLVRYQHPNHQSSCTLETDDTGKIISYEEYHPFGTTSYQATNAAITASYKRYRYTGMERDEETGLNYHNARYYIPWLGRWLNCDARIPFLFYQIVLLTSTALSISILPNK